MLHVGFAMRGKSLRCEISKKEEVLCGLLWYASLKVLLDVPGHQMNRTASLMHEREELSNEARKARTLGVQLSLLSSDSSREIVSPGGDWECGFCVGNHQGSILKGTGTVFPRGTDESTLDGATKEMGHGSRHTKEAERSQRIMSTAGLSEARLGRMHDVMSGYIERGELPGLVTLVSRRGEVHLDTMGAQAFGASAPMRHDTIFRISSMTKPIMAVAALVLVEEGKIRLDDPVDALLPELANRQVLRRLDGPLDDTVPAHRPITARDLLTFRMGFGQLMASPDAYPILLAANAQQIGMGPPSPATMPAPDEWMRRLGSLPLMLQPGEKWMYNTGSDVLGVLIARACGQPLEVFLRERLFEPLDMRDTGFSVPEKALDRLVTSYSRDPTSGKLTVYDEPRGGQWSHSPSFPSGAGGLVSTIDDLLTFGQMMLSQGKHGNARLLSRLSVELMTTDQLTAEQKAAPSLISGFLDGRGWGLGVSVITTRDDLAAVPGRYGWDGGMGTSWYCDPKEDMITILMTQGFFTAPNPANVSFWTLAYQAIDD